MTEGSKSDSTSGSWFADNWSRLCSCLHSGIHVRKYLQSIEFWAQFRKWSTKPSIYYFCLLDSLASIKECELSYQFNYLPKSRGHTPLATWRNVLQAFARVYCFGLTASELDWDLQYSRKISERTSSPSTLLDNLYSWAKSGP